MDETVKNVLIQTVIETANATYPDMQQAIKYGGTVFMTRSDKLVGGVYAYANYVSVEFSNGASFDDPERVLEGKGKARRHVKLHGLTDIDDKNVAGFLKQAFA